MDKYNFIMIGRCGDNEGDVGKNSMEMSVKERVHQAFKKQNYFDCGKKDSLEVFEKAEHLEDVII